MNLVAWLGRIKSGDKRRNWAETGVKFAKKKILLRRAKQDRCFRFPML